MRIFDNIYLLSFAHPTLTFLQDLPKDSPYSFSLYDEPLVIFRNQERKLACLSDRIADENEAHFFVGIQIENKSEIETIINKFENNGFETLDLTDDELTKLHLRHMVGGHSPQANHELLYRFEFPEYPGALMKFISSMSPNWNISLFHYRNNGSDYGKILIGLQVPPEEIKQWEVFLETLGYRYWDENNNLAYKLFLG